MFGMRGARVGSTLCVYYRMCSRTLCILVAAMRRDVAVIRLSSGKCGECSGLAKQTVHRTTDISPSRRCRVVPFLLRSPGQQEKGPLSEPLLRMLCARCQPKPHSTTARSRMHDTTDKQRHLVRKVIHSFSADRRRPGIIQRDLLDRVGSGSTPCYPARQRRASTRHFVCAPARHPSAASANAAAHRT